MTLANPRLPLALATSILIAVKSIHISSLDEMAAMAEEPISEGEAIQKFKYMKRDVLYLQFSVHACNFFEP